MTIDPTKEPLLPPSFSYELAEIPYPPKMKRQKVKTGRHHPSSSKVESSSSALNHWFLQQPILERLTHYLDFVSIKRFQLTSPAFYKSVQSFFDQAFKEKNNLFLHVSKAVGAHNLPPVFSPHDLLKKTIDIRISRSTKGFSTKRSGMHEQKTITIGPVIKVKQYNKMSSGSIKTKSILNQGMFSENHLFKFENHLAIFHEKNSRLIKILDTRTEEVTHIDLLDDEQLKQSLPLLNRNEQKLRDKTKELNLEPLNLHAMDESTEDLYETYKKYQENIEILTKAIKEANEELPLLQDTVIPLNGHLIALDWEEKFALVQCSTRLLRYDLNHPANNKVFQIRNTYKYPTNDELALQTETLLTQTFFSKQFIISCVKPCLVTHIAEIQNKIKKASENFEGINNRHTQTQQYLRSDQISKACTEMLINGRDLKNLQLALEDIFKCIEGHWRSLTDPEKQHLQDFSEALTQYNLDIKRSDLWDEHSNLNPVQFVSSLENSLSKLVGQSKFIINFLNETSSQYTKKLEALPSKYVVISFDQGKQIQTFELPKGEEFLTAVNEAYFTFKRNRSTDTYTIFAKSLLNNALLHSYTFESKYYDIDNDYEKTLYVNDQHLVMQIRCREKADSDFYAFHLDQTHNNKPEHFMYKRVHQAYITDKELVIAHDVPRDTFSFWPCERSVITFKSRILEKK